MVNYKKNYARATYDSNGAVLTTVVSIFSTSGGTVIETTLKGDHLSKSEDDSWHWSNSIKTLTLTKLRMNDLLK